MSLTKRRKDSAKVVIDKAIHSAIETAGTDFQTRDAFERLFRHVYSTTTLLQPQLGGGRIDVSGIQVIVSGLLGVAFHHTEWLRPVEDW